MTATELRIGNYVTIDNPKYHPNVKGRTLVVLSVQSWREEASVSLMHIKQEDNYVIPSLGQLIDFVKPIELNEDWLLKFGFEGEFLDYSLGKLNVCLKDPIGVYKRGRTYYNSWCILEKQPEYVHQLQNLFFALTGEELLIK